MTEVNSTPDAKAKRAAYYKAWREANKEKMLAYGAAYRAENKEAIKARIDEHYRKNAQRYKDRAAEWRLANPEKRKAIVKKWDKANPEACLEMGRRAYERHRPKRLEELKAYREKNPEKMKALQADWKARHPEATGHHVGLRRSRKMQATPAWADLKAVKAIYKKSSDLNKLGGVKYHVDHEIPLKHPLVCGLHNEFNLRVIPASENQSKRNKFDIET